MKPYYEKDGITIFNADCLEVMKTFEDKSFDLVLTDPPYGIADKWVGGKGHGWSKADKDKTDFHEWDKKPSIEHFDTIFRISKNQVIWGGNYFTLPISRCWFVWNKPERGFTLAEGELAWTSRDNVLRIFDWKRSDSDRQHPTQKPIELMRWCLDKFSDSQTILDPFMGSGTTLVASKQLGRKAVGIEISEKYCEIAVNRLAQDLLF